MDKFFYGNGDLSGDKGANNGLTNAWLSSSLEISPEEQAIFLEKLLKNALPATINAQEMTKKILYVEELPLGWKLYGKTGSGFLRDGEGKKTGIKHGWFVGWIERNHKKLVFVTHIVDEKEEEEHAGPRARAQTKEKLLERIKQMEASGS